MSFLGPDTVLKRFKKSYAVDAGFNFALSQLKSGTLLIHVEGARDLCAPSEKISTLCEVILGDTKHRTEVKSGSSVTWNFEWAVNLAEFAKKSGSLPTTIQFVVFKSSKFQKYKEFGRIEINLSDLADGVLQDLWRQLKLSEAETKRKTTFNPLNRISWRDTKSKSSSDAPLSPRSENSISSINSTNSTHNSTNSIDNNNNNNNSNNMKGSGPPPLTSLAASTKPRFFGHAKKLSLDFVHMKRDDLPPPLSNVAPDSLPVLSKSASPNSQSSKPQILVRIQQVFEPTDVPLYQFCQQNFEPIRQILLGHDLVLASTLCANYSHTPIFKHLSAALVQLFHSEGQCLRLLMQLLYRNLKRAKSAATLFRQDDMATRTARNYFSVIAPGYLQNMLKDHLQEIVDAPEQFETSPDFFPQGEVPDESYLRVCNLCSNILTTLMDQLHAVPLNMRKFFNMLYVLVNQRFTDMGARAIGSFFFLRFLCPAIVTPDFFPASALTPPVNKALIGVAKVLQNLANFATMDTEPVKMAANPVFEMWYKQKIPDVQELFYQLPNVPPDAPPDNKFVAGPDVSLKAATVIFFRFVETYDNVIQMIPEDPRAHSEKSNLQNYLFSINLIYTSYLNFLKQSKD